jgi:hypothetical protein
MYWLGGFLVLMFVIPNTTNRRERRAFSDERRLENAKEIYNLDKVADSVTVVPGNFYRRGAVAKLFLGEKHRKLWIAPVKVKVFDYEKRDLKPVDFGGGFQTISIKLEDSKQRKWSLRSVNKDQQKALPWIVQVSGLRFLARDQVASLNPYGQLVIPVLANALDITHTSPELLLVPYDEQHGKYNERMSGRVAYLEANPGGSWSGSRKFDKPEDIVDSEKMLEGLKGDDAAMDTNLYLKNRLFDMLIGDWDRHPGNWEWGVSKINGKKVFSPIAKDRDNAFALYNEGLVSHLALLFQPKFQSYRKKIRNVRALMHQSKAMDKSILRGVDAKQFEDTAREIQEQLTDKVISTAFEHYPPEIYPLAGKAHADILRARLKQLPAVAEKFHKLVNKKS